MWILFLSWDASKLINLLKRKSENKWNHDDEQQYDAQKWGEKLELRNSSIFFFYLGFSQRRLTLSPNVSTSKTCSKSHGVFMKLIKKIPKFEHGRCNDFHGDHSMCNHGCKRFDIYRKNFGSIQRLSKVLILSIIGWR